MPCECGETASLMPSAPQFVFESNTQSLAPTNTGASSVDHNFDRIIGAGSRKLWGRIVKRHAHKRKVIRENPGISGFDLSRTPDGDYRVMKPDERRAAETGRNLHHKAIRLRKDALGR